MSEQSDESDYYIKGISHLLNRYLWILDYSNIDISQTIITQEMLDKVKNSKGELELLKEGTLLLAIIVFILVDKVTLDLDYVYYYLDPQVKPPKIAYYFEPDEDTIVFDHGSNVKERMIFPSDGPYSEKEEKAYDDFVNY